MDNTQIRGMFLKTALPADQPFLCVCCFSFACQRAYTKVINKFKKNPSSLWCRMCKGEGRTIVQQDFSPKFQQFLSSGKHQGVLATAFLLQASHHELTSHWPSARWVDATQRTSAIQNNLPFTRTSLFYHGTALLFVLICVLYSLPCSRSPYTRSTSWINGKLSEKKPLQAPSFNNRERCGDVTLSIMFRNETLKPKTNRTQWSLMKLFNASAT